MPKADPADSAAAPVPKKTEEEDAKPAEAAAPSSESQEQKSARHVPTPPSNTEFNSVFRQRLKMRLSPKLTPIILVCGGFKGLYETGEGSGS